MITVEIVNDQPPGGVSVLLLSGRLDSRNAPALEGRLAELTGARAVVLDLAGVDYISSAGLRLLLLVARQSGRLALCAPQAHVLDVLRISGLTRAFRIHAERHAAVAELSVVP